MDDVPADVDVLGDFELHGHQLTDAYRLPCGCIFGLEEATKTMCIEPCSPSCQYYRYAVREVRAQGKGIEVEEVERRN